MEPLNDTDIEVRNYLREGGPFVEIYEFVTLEGEYYRMCCDQDGEEWIED